jgi:hypothetical protein
MKSLREPLTSFFSHKNLSQENIMKLHNAGGITYTFEFRRQAWVIFYIVVQRGYYLWNSP